MDSQSKCVKCMKVRPNFGLIGSRATHCASCAHPGMVDVNNPKCIVCQKVRPSFGVAGGRVTHCESCVGAIMVNMKFPKCISCQEKRPSYGVAGGSATHCGSCAHPGMVDVKNSTSERVSDMAQDVPSLANQRPDVAAEWHPTENNSLRPDDCLVGSCKKVWWMCQEACDGCGERHEYAAPVSHRTAKSPVGCPVCAGRALCTNKCNSLAKQRPDLAAEWHPTKNGTLSPHDVVVGSSKKVWWKCEKSHEYATRGAPKHACPVCCA